MKPDTLRRWAKAATSATCCFALPLVTDALLSANAGVTVRPRAQYGANRDRK